LICKVHYHFATGHEAKNKGKLYRCMNTGKDPPFGCCLDKAYDKRGRLLGTFKKTKQKPIRWTGYFAEQLRRDKNKQGQSRSLNAGKRGGI